MFGPREVLLTSDEPVVEQFLNGRRLGPIGMSEEKDSSELAREQAQADAGHHDGSTEDVRGIVPQLQPTPGLPERQAVRRRKNRVIQMLNTLPRAAQEGIIDSLTPAERQEYGIQAPVVAGTQYGQLPAESIAQMPSPTMRGPEPGPDHPHPQQETR